MTQRIRRNAPFVPPESHTNLFRCRPVCRRDGGLRVAAFIVLWAAKGSTKMGGDWFGAHANGCEKHEKTRKRERRRLLQFCDRTASLGRNSQGFCGRCQYLITTTTRRTR